MENVSSPTDLKPDPEVDPKSSTTSLEATNNMEASVDYTMVSVPISEIVQMEHNTLLESPDSSKQLLKSVPQNVGSASNKFITLATQKNALTTQKNVSVEVDEELQEQQPSKSIQNKDLLVTCSETSSEIVAVPNDEVSTGKTDLVNVTTEDTNTKVDDIVMVLSDSDDEDATKTENPIKTLKNDDKSSSGSSIVTPIADPVPAVETDIPKPKSPEAIQSEKNESKCDDDVIMLDDSPDNSDTETAEVPVVQPKVDSVVASRDVDEKSKESTEITEPLRLIEKLVEDCYQMEKEVVSTKTPPPLVVDNICEATPSALETLEVSKLNETQSKEPAFRIIGIEKLLDESARKAQENWECINFQCKSKKLSAFCKAPLFALNHFNVPRKVTRPQFICEKCFNECVDEYERMCQTLVNHQPLLMEKLPIRPELVEILDSSEEEDNGGSNKYIDDTKSLSLDTLTLLEDHFDDALNDAMNRIQIDMQVSWTSQILQHKMVKNEAMADELDIEIKSLQKLADSMYEKLYRNTNFVIEELPPFDLNTNKQMNMAGPTYPPSGEVIYPPVDQNSLYYAVKTKLIMHWSPCKVTEFPDALLDGKKSFKIRFLRAKGVLTKTVPGNHLAYGTAPGVRLTVGTRVIALFTTKEPGSNNENFKYFPGIIAEPLQAYNRWRYLIFFDDGYTQYVTPDNVRLVCLQSQNCWDDVYPDSAEFIKTYFNQYRTQRPMVQVRRGQRMITERNGEWNYARVNDMDGSLVQMFFETEKVQEWIYRGSTRLGPLYKDRQIQKHSVSSGKRNEPFVEYMTIDDDGKSQSNQQPIQKSVAPPKPVAKATSTLNVPSTSQAPVPVEEKRSVAKKSVSAAPRPTPTVQHMNNATIYVEEDSRPKGKVVYYTAKKHMPPRKFVRHNCGSTCLYEVKHNLSSYSPLAKPLLSGWERKILRNKSRKIVVYRGPCGRTLRNMSELHKYLRVTKCSLNVDNFDFDYLIHCLAEYVIESCIVQKQDLSDGCEPMVVACVNYYDNTMPPPCVYSAKRVPNEGVNLNLDTNFMCGCDCEDDCMDKTKCQCWKLTLDGAQFGNPNTPIDQVGYEFKRLPNSVPTGIYECNSRCKCSKTCLNRVAQHPLQMKLQVFKTVSRGWGLRCLNDVPKGSFICVYAGDLMTEQNANIAGDNYGDEYFAELDYIEVVESLKEGYEPGILDDDDDEEYDGKNKDDSDDDEYVASEPVFHGPRQTRYNTRHSVDPSNGKKVEPTKAKSHPTSSGSNSDDEDAQRQLISFVPNANSASFENNSTGRYKSIRKFYGKNESVFIMDAKKKGNIGRYFNHSCSPNLFVQNVFVDTHDLRFPWVAFFALSHIRAGSELTWNYNYDVGSVPGKVMYCECGADNCRGRLL